MDHLSGIRQQSAIIDPWEFFQPLKINNHTLRVLALDLAEIYKRLALHSFEQFLATAINVLPSGNETGRFLALDIGGTNLRVAFVDLLGRDANGNSQFRKVYDRSWPIENRFKIEKAEDLFAWIGGCIGDVIETCQADLAQGDSIAPESLDVLPVGISWSFPMIQNSISEATLMPMGKGFAITNELNLSKLIHAGYARWLKENCMPANRMPSIKVVAITNDTVATLASHAYLESTTPERKVVMGLIVGTGTNAAIVMKMKDLHSRKTELMTLPTTADSIVVNTEWTIRGAAEPLRKHEIFTKWDNELDRCCEAPGFQPFEYLAGGRYLGEIVRLACLDYFCRYERARKEDLPVALRMRYGLDTRFLSDTVAPLKASEDIYNESIPAPNGSTWKWDHERMLAIETATRYVRNRSAKMVAAAVVGALLCTGDLKPKQGDEEVVDNSQELVVAYTGGVISSFPEFYHQCSVSIDYLVKKICGKKSTQRIRLEEVENGGVFGAGVLAGTVCSLPQS